MSNRSVPHPRKMLPIDEVMRDLSYDPSTGVFIRIRHARQPELVGHEAGYTNRSGYREIRVLGKTMLAHRIAWAICTGEWPSVGIDHINGDRRDNRIANLRPATQSQNLANRGVRRDSRSGIKGVYQNLRTKKWEARISLGGFATAAEAVEAHAYITKLAWGEFGRSAEADALRAVAGRPDRPVD